MKSFLRHAFSGRDNTTTDLGRVLWAVFSVALVALQAARISAFDPISFASGAAAILAAGGAGIALKAKTEPEAK